MLTVFSSNFSRNSSGGTLSSVVLIDPVGYYCYYYDHDALTNASVHFTSAADSTSSTTCRNLNVYRIKGSGSFNFSVDYDVTSGHPYTGSVLLYVMKYSEGQKTNYTTQTIDIKTLPLYTGPADVVFHRRFFSSSRVPRTYSSYIRFDVRTNITIKPNQRLRCCLVYFFGQRPNVKSFDLDLTTTVFYNGN